MSKKQLLLESCDFSFTCNLSEEEKNTLTESLKISAGKNGNLIVKNIPCTILDRVNQNGRIYPTALMQKAIEEARPKMKAKMLLCSGSEHPQNSFPEPKEVSHCVINAYIKNVEIEVEGKREKHNVLFNDWEILNEKSEIGAQVQQLILSGFGIGTSIRSLGSCDANNVVTELEYLGTDIVGQPSSSTFVNMPINESVEVSTAPLNETFVVSASATNVVRSIDDALVLTQKIDNANFGTVKKTSTKLDSEIDPKTGAETTMVTLETETEDEVTDVDQALALAKQAIMNGQADIDSVTIENVKEEQPKESAENNDVPVLNEEEKDPMYLTLKKSNYYHFNTPEEYMQFINDNVKYLDNGYSLPEAEEIFAEYTDNKISPELACHKLEGFVGNIINKTFDKDIPALNENEDDTDDTERYEVCSWCGEKLPLSDLKKEKDLGYICNHCARGLESREGPLNFEECEYVPESAMKEDGNENPYVLLGKICQNSTEDSWIQKKARQMANSFEHGEIDQPTFVARLNDMILANDFKLPESKMTEAGVDKLLDEIRSIMYNEGLSLEQACRKYCEHHDNIPYEYVLEYMRTNPVNESVIKEAKEEKKDPTEGQKYVLKTEQGFVAMDGNAIKFVEQPKDAIHFVKGKEESGVIHLSGINKILDTMGIYDVEKYYKKGTTDISAHDDVNVQAVNTDENKEEVKEGLIMGDGGVVTKPNEITGMPIKEDNGSNTRFNAIVEIQGANGTSSETIPVSAVEMEGINNEVGNLYNMKSQKADGQVQITVNDTTSGAQYIYNPETQSVEPVQMQQESAGELKQDGNKVSMEIDDKNTVEKEFENPAQASVVKAGLEQGKLGGDVLMSEDGERLQYQDAPDYSEENIQPGWYAGSKDPNVVGIIGPYDSKEELLAGLNGYQDQINIRYVSPEEAGIAAESTKIDEVLYNEPGEASDPMVTKTMTDAIEQDIVVSVNNIDWNVEDLINKFTNNAEAGDPVNFGDIQSKINDLPETLDIRMKKDELPDDVDINTLKDAVKNKIAQEYVMNINDLAITDLHSVN